MELGKEFGRKLKGGEVIFLTGDLGGGKTQFTKGVALGLGIKDEVTSPTFVFQNIYQGRFLRLYHFDLYRNDEVSDDVKDLMLESFSDPDGVVVVEWAQKAKKHWPENYHLFSFSWLAEKKRKIEHFFKKTKKGSYAKTG